MATAWDGSTAQTHVLDVGCRQLPIKIWDSATVAAGGPVDIAVWAFADTGRGPNSWDAIATRQAGPPPWGRGGPPRPAIGAVRSEPDDANWRSPRHRFVAVSGAALSDPHPVDVDLVLGVTAHWGTPHVVVGHGIGANAVMQATDRTTPAILLDGGVPVGDLEDDVLRAGRARRAPAYLVTAPQPGGWYSLSALKRLLNQVPRLGWHGLADCDHHSLLAHQELTRLLPALIWRAHTGQTLSVDGAPLRHQSHPAGPQHSAPPAPPTVVLHPSPRRFRP